MSLIAGSAVLTLSIASYVAAVLVCMPISHFWKPLGPGHCFNFSIYYLITSVAEALTDFAILILPVHMISRLQLSYKNKALLSVIFSLGGL